MKYCHIFGFFAVKNTTIRHSLLQAQPALLFICLLILPFPLLYLFSDLVYCIYSIMYWVIGEKWFRKI